MIAQKEEAYKRLFDSTNGVFIHLSTDALILDLNVVAERVLNTHSTLLHAGENFLVFCYQHDLKLANFIKAVMTSKFPDDQPFVEKIFSHTISWNLVNAENIDGESSGFFLLGSKVQKDVVLTELEDQILFYEDILSKLPTNVYWKDRNGIYMGCNDRLARSMGLSSRHAIKGMTDFDFDWGEEAAEKFIAFDKKVMDTEQSLTTEDVFKEASGRVVTVLTNKTPMKNRRGETIGLLAISVDITEKKKMELALLDEKKRAEAASHAKSEFIANMSHDMRTPITAMLGVMQSLLANIEESRAILQSESGIYSESKYNAILNERVERAYQDNSLLMATTNELLTLFNDILEAICLESGQSKQTVESFAIRECLEHSKQLQQPVAQDKHLQLTYTISKHVPIYLTGIRAYLDRILLNLVSNGLKFTQKGLVHIHVSLEGDAEQPFKTGDTVQLKISVEDSGIGIPKDKFEMIFEHFSRLTSSYNSGYKGAGLGLYAVKQYVSAMKGKIDVTSTVGKGSCFTVVLPFTVSDHTDQRVPAILLSDTLNHQISSTITASSIKKKSGESPASKSATRKVLIVEDHPLAARAISLPLERNFNCAVDIVENGTEAVEVAKKGNYHLIFMDIGLPDFCGIEATKRIRKFNRDVPIIALTGHAGNSDKGQEAKAAGMQAVLTKPAKPLELEHILQQYSLDNKTIDESELDSCFVSDNVLDKSQYNNIINWENCVQQCHGDPNYARSLLSELIEDLEKNVKKTLSEIYSLQDETALRKELHRIRGGVCYFDLPQLASALEVLHLTLSEKDISSEKVKNLYYTLQQHIDTLCMTWKKQDF